MSNFDLIKNAGHIMWNAARSAVHSRLPRRDGLLYHYTDANGLLGVLGAAGRTAQLWATHHSFLNDPAEGQDFYRVLSSVVGRFQESCDVSNPVGLRQANLAGNLSHPSYKLGTTRYVVSFAEDPDNLTQWRLYGADGNGFALGLRPDALSSLCTATSSKGVLLPVVYDVHAKEEVARLVIEQIVGALPNVTETLPEILNQPGTEDLLRYAAMYASSLAEEEVGAAFKAESYQSECEWRLVFRGFDPDVLQPNEPVAPEDEQALKTLNYRVSGGRIVPYVTADIADLPSLVSEVVVGPCQPRDLTGTALGAVLAGRQLHGPGKCVVSYSAHEYRGR